MTSAANGRVERLNKNDVLACLFRLFTVIVCVSIVQSIALFLWLNLVLL